MFECKIYSSARKIKISSDKCANNICNRSIFYLIIMCLLEIDVLYIIVIILAELNFKFHEIIFLN